MERGLVGIINPLDAILPPKALERRNHIVEKTIDSVVGLITHLQSIGYGVKNTYRLLISSAHLVGIPRSPDSNVICRRNRHYFRPVFRQIEFLVLFLEIKRHSNFLLSGQDVILFAIQGPGSDELVRLDFVFDIVVT